MHPPCVWCSVDSGYVHLPGPKQPGRAQRRQWCGRSAWTKRDAGFHGLLVLYIYIIYGLKNQQASGFRPIMVARIGRTQPCCAAKLSPDIRLRILSMSLNPLTLLEKAINEHGSSVILGQRLDLVKEMLTKVQKEKSDLGD